MKWKSCIPSDTAYKRINTVLLNIITAFASARPLLIEDFEVSHSAFLDEQSVDTSLTEMAIYGVLSALRSSTKESSVKPNCTSKS